MRATREHETESDISPDQTPDVRVLLYCFKPPQPRAAASPPPRRADDRSNRVQIKRLSDSFTCLLQVAPNMRDGPRLRRCIVIPVDSQALVGARGFIDLEVRTGLRTVAKAAL